MRRIRLCTLKRRVRLSRGLPRSAPATLHLQDPGFYICLSVRESFSTRRELRNTQGLPIHDSVNEASLLLMGESSWQQILSITHRPYHGSAKS